MAEKKFQGKRYYRHDFTADGMDLTKADFRDAILIECSFEGIDLSYALFDGANVYGSSFKDATLDYASFKDATLVRCDMNVKSIIDATFTLNCNTFSEVKVNDNLFVYWLYMACQMTGYDQELRNKIIVAIGAEKYAAVHRMFKVHV